MGPLRQSSRYAAKEFVHTLCRGATRYVALFYVIDTSVISPYDIGERLYAGRPYAFRFLAFCFRY